MLSQKRPFLRQPAVSTPRRFFILMSKTVSVINKKPYGRSILDTNTVLFEGVFHYHCDKK